MRPASFKSNKISLRGAWRCVFRRRLFGAECVIQSLNSREENSLPGCSTSHTPFPPWSWASDSLPSSSLSICNSPFSQNKDINTTLIVPLPQWTVIDIWRCIDYSEVWKTKRKKKGFSQTRTGPKHSRRVSSKTGELSGNVLSRFGDLWDKKTAAVKNETNCGLLALKKRNI